MNSQASQTQTQQWLIPTALFVAGYLCFAIAFTITTCGWGQAYVLFTTLPVLLVGKWPIDIIILALAGLFGTTNPITTFLGGNKTRPYLVGFVIVCCIGLGLISGDSAFVGKCA